MALDGGKMKHITDANIRSELSDSSKYAEFESGCQFVGYVCIKDPVRPEVKEAIMDCRTAGVNVIMITGDAKETAISIAQELNILTGEGKNSSWTGAEFEALTYN
jgi:P-type E1-E2 ATPase